MFERFLKMLKIKSHGAEECILNNLAKFTGKHLCRSLFFNQIAALQLFYSSPPVAASASLQRSQKLEGLVKLLHDGGRYHINILLERDNISAFLRSLYEVICYSF